MDTGNTILIVDDEALMRETLGELLSAEGYCLAFASNGQEAMEVAAALGPDLILLDVKMPGMDGFEVCQRLRSTPHLAQVPIIMITVLGDTASRVHGIECGADDLLSKPFDAVELSAKVRTITQLNRYRRLLEEQAQRQKAEKDRRDNLELLETLVDTIPNPVFYTNANGVYMGCNRAFARLIVGQDRGDIVGRRHYELPRVTGLEPVDNARDRERLFLPSGNAPTYEALVRCADGLERDFVVSKAVFRDASGQVAGIVGVMVDISERKRAELKIIRQRQELQRLSAQLIEAQEAERARLSRELHDELGQALTAMSLNLAELYDQAPTAGGSLLQERIHETRDLVEQTLDQVRGLALELRPSMLDDLGLVDTLRWYLNRWATTYGLEIDFDAKNMDLRLPAAIETALYRVVQEALTNVARHAQASRVYLRLEREPSKVMVQIRDNGCGFDADAVSVAGAAWHGVGLVGMRERAALLGGELDIWSRSGRGTRLHVEIPLDGQVEIGP